MRRNLTFAVLTTVLTAGLLSTGVASATPPTGGVQFKDLARVQAVEGAAVPIKLGTTLMSGSYSIASSGRTGWRKLPGEAVLAVTKGRMSVHRADGCSAKDYAEGQAAVLPAGTYLIQDSGKQPLKFFGLFFDLPANAPMPLADGAPAATPAGCTDAPAAPSGVALTDPVTGKMVPGMFGNGATLNIEAGKDIYAGFLDFSPGFSSGWLTHTPMMNLVSGGVLSYVMARDGKCETSDKYRAGQAFYHPPHRHMAYNEGNTDVLLTSVYFDLPHDTPAPVIGNITTANDFTQAPPPDCPRLR